MCLCIQVSLYFIRNSNKNINVIANRAVIKTISHLDSFNEKKEENDIIFDFIKQSLSQIEKFA